MKSYQEIKELIVSQNNKGITVQNDKVNIMTLSDTVETVNDEIDMKSILDGLIIDYGINLNRFRGTAKFVGENIRIVLVSPPISDCRAIFITKF